MLWWESQQEDVICIESTRLVFWPNAYLATSSSTSVMIQVQDVSKFDKPGTILFHFLRLKLVWYISNQ